VRANPGGKQVDAAWFLEQMRPPAASVNALATVGVTSSDIYAANLGWVFGMNSPNSRLSGAVLSLDRMGDPKVERVVCLRRTIKVLTFLVAQAIWIRDYPGYACVMNPPNSRPELDSTRLECCPECEQKIWWACGISPYQRYAPLIQFANKHGLESEAQRWEQVQRLIGTGPR
jgi:archaemetzincin